MLRFQVDVNLGGCYPTLYLAQALAPRSGVKELLVGAPWGQVGHYMPHAQGTKPSWFGGIFGILAMKGSGPRRPGYIGVLGHPTLCLNNGGGGCQRNHTMADGHHLGHISHKSCTLVSIR